MAAQKKQYFLAPSWDYPPTGPLALGNIILSPSRPVPPLLAASTLTRTLDPATLAPNRVSTTKHNVEWTRDKSVSHSLGVWSRFVQCLGVRLDFETSRSRQDVFRFESVRTEEWFPSEEYLAAAVRDPAVRRRLTVGGGISRVGGLVKRRAVYVVVGVKTVSGAQVKRVWTRGLAAQTEVGVDAMGASVFVASGPAGGVKWERGESMEFEGGDDFVFAYRVRKVWLEDGENGVGQDDYARGTMLGESYGDEKEEKGDGMDHIVVEDLEDSDIGDKWTGGEVEDEGEEIEVFVPAAGN